jgi:hypothetical protein
MRFPLFLFAWIQRQFSTLENRRQATPLTLLSLPSGYGPQTVFAPG